MGSSSNTLYFRTLLLEHPLGILVCVACAATLASEYVEHVLDGVVRSVMQFAKVGTSLLRLLHCPVSTESNPRHRIGRRPRCRHQSQRK